MLASAMSIDEQKIHITNYFELMILVNRAITLKRSKIFIGTTNKYYKNHLKVTCKRQSSKNNVFLFMGGGEDKNSLVASDVMYVFIHFHRYDNICLPYLVVCLRLPTLLHAAMLL